MPHGIVAFVVIVLAALLIHNAMNWSAESPHDDRCRFESPRGDGVWVRCVRRRGHSGAHLMDSTWRLQ